MAKKATKTVTVTLTGSACGTTKRQRGTLLGLGLTKRERPKTLEDTAAVRGMIRKVDHLVTVSE